MKKYIILLTILLIFSVLHAEGEENIPISVDSLLIIAPETIDNQVVIYGQVDHICRHSSQKLTLLGVDTTLSIHVIIEDDSLEFESTINGKNIIITGIVKEFRIDEEYLKEWEKSLEDVDLEEFDEEYTEHHNEKMDEVEELREAINSSENGYISEFWIEYIDIEIKE